MKLSLPWRERHDLWLVGGLAVVMLGALAPVLGVWEPWEAETAIIADTMRETGHWLRIQLPMGADEYRVLPELPFGWWPVVGSMALLGEGELALRLPGLAFALPALLVLFLVGRRLFGRVAAWFAVLATLTMPLFAYHARLALGAGVSAAVIAIAALAFIRIAADDEAGARWVWLAWLSLALAGLTAGVPGLAAPLLAGAATVAVRIQGGEARGPLLSRVFAPAPALIALTLVGLGWWRTTVYQPDGHSLAALLLWSDRIDVASLKLADRPTLEAFVHQIGFGLFPFGGLVPFALGVLLWGAPRDDEPDAAGPAAQGLCAWFAVAFLAPALAAPYSHFAIFLGAPAIGLAVGVYLARVLRSPPEPLLLVGTILLVALLDSNLKHETQALADVLVGERVDAFPPELPGWKLARLLDFALLGLLIVFQGGLYRWFEPAVKVAAYPKRRVKLRQDLRELGALVGLRMRRLPGHLGTMAIFATLALVPVVAVMAPKPEFFMKLLGQPFWGRTVVWLRVVQVGLVAWLVVYLALRLLWNLRARQLDGAREGWLTRGADRLKHLALRPGVRLASLGGVLLAFGVFLNAVVADTLTDNFSQKDILHAYQDLAADEEPLFTYKVPEATRSFYTRGLPELSRKQFAEQADGDRFFAIIPRDQLARINTEFRKASQRTLPVLHDESYRYLLVSNRLGADEVDNNPIKRALVEQVPGDAQRVKINFEDKIELVGWKLDPPVPKAGSPLSINLYWRAMKNVTGNWKVFVHLDAPGQRIHGDHDPVAGLFPTSDWRKGDIVHDEHKVVVKRTISADDFTFYVGLYRGGTRLKVKEGPRDRENRAKLGRVRVR